MPSEFVMKGNAAILKCSIPSFVADFVYVTAWVDDEGNEILPSEDEFEQSLLNLKYYSEGNRTIFFFSKIREEKFIIQFPTIVKKLS